MAELFTKMKLDVPEGPGLGSLLHAVHIYLLDKLQIYSSARHVHFCVEVLQHFQIVFVMCLYQSLKHATHM